MLYRMRSQSMHFQTILIDYSEPAAATRVIWLHQDDNMADPMSIPRKMQRMASFSCLKHLSGPLLSCDESYDDHHHHHGTMDLTIVYRRTTAPIH